MPQPQAFARGAATDQARPRAGTERKEGEIGSSPAAPPHPNRYAPLNEWETFHDSDDDEEASESDDDIRTEIDHKCHVTQGMYLFAATEPIRHQHGVFLTTGKVGLWRTAM